MDGPKPFKGSVAICHARRCVSIGLAALFVTFSIGGCAHFGGTSLIDWYRNGFKVGPNYRKPVAPLNPIWTNSSPDASSPCSDVPYLNCPPEYEPPSIPTFTTNQLQRAEWWDEAFGDPLLNELVTAAYQQNLTLQQASFRVLEARALLGATVGGLFPQSQTATGSYLHRQLPSNITSNNWNLGFGLAWEVDVWGRLRRRIEAADANLNASIENYDAVLLTLIADVASTYVEIRTLQHRIDIACRNLERQLGTVRAAKAAIDNLGDDRPREVKEIALVQSQTNALQTQATIPPLQAGLAQAINRMSILLGIPPQDLRFPIDENGTYVPQSKNIDVAVGVPANLLRRRPDVRAAERAVAAQSAVLGVSVAELYPAFTLNGNVNWSADQLSDVFRTSSFGGAVNPTFRWNILNYARIRNVIAANEAVLGRLAVSYQSAVLNAQLEVENAMAAYARQYQAVDLLRQAAAASLRTVDDARRFREANAEVQAAYGSNFAFVSQATLLANEDALARAQQALAVSLISLYRALGGGWEIRLRPATELAIGSAIQNSDTNDQEEIVPPAPDFAEF